CAPRRTGPRVRARWGSARPRASAPSRSDHGMRPQPGQSVLHDAQARVWQTFLNSSHHPIIRHLSPEFIVTLATEQGIPATRTRALALAGLAIAITALNLRTAVTGFTPLLEIIGEHLGYGVALAGLLGTVPTASFAAFGFLAPVVTRRFGLERTATVALALTAVSLMVRAVAPTPGVLVLSTILALAGIG